jgi:hypothetical protein
MGALGFCYLAYHFVYDYKYPVMIQLHSTRTGEIFQFPTAVVIEKSNPRKSLGGEAINLDFSEICENANTEFEVITLDSSSRPVESEISIECATQTCDIGTTEDGIVNNSVPQRANGYIIANAEGYETTGIFASTIQPGSVTIFLDKKYEKEFSIYQNSKLYSGEAMITFEDENGKINTLLYPNSNKIELSEGNYIITVTTYEEISLELGSTKQEYCVEVPRNILGIFGLTKQECTEIEVPEQLISKAVSGGGSGKYYFSENNLRNRNLIEIETEKFPEPNSIVQIQNNYILLENKEIGIDLI